VAADREAWYVAITDFPRGLGSTTRSRSICTALRIAGRHPRLLIPYAIGHGINDQASGVEDGVPYEYMNGSVLRPRGARRVVQAKLGAGIRLTRRLWVARRRVSSVFLYNMSAFDGWPVLLAARMLRIPVVLDLTDEWHDPSIPIRHLGFARYGYQVLSRALEGVMFRGVQRIIVVSRHLERRLEQHARKVRRLPMLFDPGRFECGPIARPAGGSGPSICYAGSISTIEGVHILLEALARLPDGAGGRATLRIIGAPAHGDSIETYSELAARLGISDRVTFEPALDRDRYAATLRGADLLVIPRTTGYASQAGFPYKLGEYLATGTPLVVTRFGDVEEYFVDRRDCFMCAPDDAAALAVMIGYALDHQEDARAIGRRGQSRARELFAFDKVAGVLDAMLRELEGAADGGVRAIPGSSG
jgi:glycosyltransferase involved in cell wall biosynthesis